MKILEAYCVELDQVLDIHAAQEAYFAQPEGTRKRFTFRCSEPACRAAENPATVSGVNYDELAEETEKYRQMHFRAPDNGKRHLASCVWVQGEAHRLATQLRVSSEPSRPRIERAKDTDVVDVFSPMDFDAPAVLAPALRSGAAVPAVVAVRHRPTGSGPQYAGDGINRARRLEQLVNVWSELDVETRRQASICLDGRDLTYHQACLHVSSIWPSENGTRVVYGRVRAKYWPQNNPSRLYLNFADPCERFDEHDGKRSLVIDIPLDRLSRYRGGALLMKRIKHSEREGSYLRAYAWGIIKPREGKAGYALEIAALDSLVIKVIEPRSA